MLEIKDFYQIASKKPNVQKIVSFILNEEGVDAEGAQSSMNASLTVLNTLLQLYHDKCKSTQKKDDDDDETTM